MSVFKQPFFINIFSTPFWLIVFNFLLFLLAEGFVPLQRVSFGIRFVCQNNAVTDGRTRGMNAAIVSSHPAFLGKTCRGCFCTDSLFHQLTRGVKKRERKENERIKACVPRWTLWALRASARPKAVRRRKETGSSGPKRRTVPGPQCSPPTDRGRRAPPPARPSGGAHSTPPFSHPTLRDVVAERHVRRGQKGAWPLGEPMGWGRACAAGGRRARVAGWGGGRG